MTSHLTLKDLDEAYVFAKSTDDLETLRKVAEILVRECVRLRQVTEIAKREFTLAQEELEALKNDRPV